MQPAKAVKRPIQRPIVGFILSVIGGLFSAAGGLYDLATLQPYYYYGYPNYQAYGWIGFGSGICILAGAALLYLAPRYRVGWGVLVLLGAVASIFSLYGPAFPFALFGVPLALVGGSLGIAWSPSTAAGFEEFRTCLTCGRHIRAEYVVCPFCGARASAAPPGPETPPSPP